MWNMLYDLEAAEAHWQQLQDEAANERLIRTALKERAPEVARPTLSRLLDRLRGERPSNTDPHKN